MPARISQSRFWFFVVLCALITASALTAGGIAIYARSNQQRSTNAQICAAVNNINMVITQTLERSKTNLPRLSYYKHHPHELANQLAEIDLSLALFRPRSC